MRGGQGGGLDADAIAAQFTSPPARVRAEAKAKLRAEAEALLPAPTWGYASSADSFYPPVAVLASEGADGLGTWYAVRVAQTLFRRRAPCFVCAMSPTDHPQTQHAFMMSKLPQAETQAAVARASQFVISSAASVAAVAVALHAARAVASDVPSALAFL